jgi:hypothetical protein
MKTILTLLVPSVFAIGANANETIPHIFSPSTPAKASEVNENFDYLNSRLNELEETFPSNGAEVLELDIDCTNNPAALNEAYLQNKLVKNLSFSIKGSCYGDIYTPRVEGEFVTTVQSQVIAIAGVDETATLIDNDLTGSINLWATFSGGLYLRDLSITTSGVIPVAFSRNSHGDIYNVKITKTEGDAFAGIYVQEGAQIYLGNVEVNGFDTGITGRNGAVIRTTGDISITALATGISLQSSVFRGYGDININAPENAVHLDFNSSWRGWGTTLNVTKGNISVNTGSAMVTETINAPNSLLDVYHSTFNGNGLSVDTVSANGSTVTLSDSSITGEVTSHQNAKVEIYNTPLTSVNVWLSSFIYGGGTLTNLSVHGGSRVHLGEASIVENIDSNMGSIVDIYKANITGNVYINSNSTMFANESTFGSNAFLHINDGGVSSLFSGTTIDEEQTSCYFGSLDIENVDVNAFDNGCLNTGGYQEMVDVFKNSRNN